MTLYRCTVEKWSKDGKRVIFSDLEDFNRDRLKDKINNAIASGWFFKSGVEVEATENQIKTGEYLGMIEGGE